MMAIKAKDVWFLTTLGIGVNHLLPLSKEKTLQSKPYGLFLTSVFQNWRKPKLPVLLVLKIFYPKVY